MKLKMKPTDEILLKILRNEFMKEMATNPVSIAFVSFKKSEEIQKLFEKWLIENEYAYSLKQQ